MMVYTVTVKTKSKTIYAKAEGGTLLSDALAQSGVSVSAACGGRGVCGKCRVRLTEGDFSEVVPDENGYILSCRARVCMNATVEVPEYVGGGLSDVKRDFSPTEAAATGVVFDIGTTTIAAAMKKADGTLLTRSFLNPQSNFGADVISRIEACGRGKLAAMRDAVVEATENALLSFGKELSGNGGQADRVIISGNTTMLHIFCGISPDGIGKFPFTPAFTELKRFSGADMGLSAREVTVLPSASAYIGSDIISGIVALGFDKPGGVRLLADIGTNGELALSVGEEIYCASTAAGPAFEGACIECGIGGIPGAVDSVSIRDKKVSYTTIGGTIPVGICGSGIVDAIASMLDEEIVDESGYMECDRFDICEGVYLTQADVRQFQLAKSAVCAGIEALLSHEKLTPADVCEFHIAGGLGYHMNIHSAVRTGLIPACLEKAVRIAGNTNLEGELLCLDAESGSETIARMERVGRSCHIVELSESIEFSERFIANMFFGK